MGTIPGFVQSRAGPSLPGTLTPAAKQHISNAPRPRIRSPGASNKGLKVVVRIVKAIRSFTWQTGSSWPTGDVCAMASCRFVVSKANARPGADPGASLEDQPGSGKENCDCRRK
ncbi:hypothetical protein ZHAS_00009125 [Anopheles sinensis]|uniref:Uncharacterized protein n=1 Tax=Anopheles sinensis TaxID=74873 RepID=A0A084VU76_ANOSI|nr:hypothetical protein ZHAS_00009125 [Anopheles sinensis]